VTGVDSQGIIFSVIVPTRRRPSQLAQCLGALAEQDYPHDAYEVVVVHDGESAQQGKAALNGSVPGLSVRVVKQPSRGPATARNTGASFATGTHLVFTDDDCIPAPDWLSRLARHFDRSPDSAIGGLTVNALAAMPCSVASQLLVDYLYEYYRAAQTGARFFTTNNFAVETRAFRELQGFDGTFPFAGAEDREFCERWQRSGRHLVYAEDARVYHSHRLDLRGFLRQHFTYGRGADVLHQCRARHAGKAQLSKLEPARFYINLVLYPFTRRLRWKAVPLTALMALSQAAYAAGYFTERLRRAWRSRNGRSSIIPAARSGRQRHI
jgi:GT2 family glycosyltransferase